MRPRIVKEPFDDADYIFELKQDGFRAVAYLQDGACKLISRNMNRLHFTSLARDLSKLPVENAILDGEVVCLDSHGVSQFNELLNRKDHALLYAFDLLWQNGEDLRSLPLIQRKLRLNKLIGKSKCERIIYAQHIQGDGRSFFREICSRDLEGIVAKRKLSTYKDNGLGWLKIKIARTRRRKGGTSC